jgi:hypothetical protein
MIIFVRRIIPLSKTEKTFGWRDFGQDQGGVKEWCGHHD